MRHFFTADCHFGHANIIRYCGRPFKTLEEMDKKLIKNWNTRVKSDDIVLHVGDFCFRNSPGGKRGEGGRTKASEYSSQLNGTIIHFKGNHDKNNGVKGIIRSAVIETAGRRFMVTHLPPSKASDVIGGCKIVLCGHIHDKWDYKVLVDHVTGSRIALINIGVDVWKYKPIEINEIMSLYAKIKRKGEV